jgi:hypothetical protein
MLIVEIVVMMKTITWGVVAGVLARPGSGGPRSGPAGAAAPLRVGRPCGAHRTPRARQDHPPDAPAPQVEPGGDLVPRQPVLTRINRARGELDVAVGVGE